MSGTRVLAAAAGDGRHRRSTSVSCRGPSDCYLSPVMSQSTLQARSRHSLQCWQVQLNTSDRNSSELAKWRCDYCCCCCCMITKMTMMMHCRIASFWRITCKCSIKPYKRDEHFVILYGITNHIRKLGQLYHPIVWYKCKSLRMWFIIQNHKILFQLVWSESLYTTVKLSAVCLFNICGSIT